MSNRILIANPDELGEDKSIKCSCITNVGLEFLKLTDKNEQRNFLEVDKSNILIGDFTVATLPSASDNVKKYAWVTDLHDSQPDLCLSDGTYWKPIRSFGVKSIIDADNDVTLIPLVNSPTVILKGILSASRTLTLSIINAYPGAKFRIKREAIGIFDFIIDVLGSLGLNSWIDVEYDPDYGWVQTASGGLI